MSAINPKALYHSKGIFPDFAVRGSYSLTEKLKNNAKNAIGEKNQPFLKRHVVSRLLFTAAAVSAVVTRVVDAAAAAIAMVASFLTCGTIKELNYVANKHSSISLIVNDLLYLIPQIILANPRICEEL